MLRYHADLVLGHQLLDSHACKGSVDVETLRKHGRRNQLVLGHLLVQLLIRILVKEDKVVRFLLDLQTKKADKRKASSVRDLQQRRTVFSLTSSVADMSPLACTHL